MKQIIKWTKVTCIADAKKFTSKNMWQKAPNSGYKIAAKYLWLDECCQHMQGNLKWTKEACIADARKFKYRN